AFEHRVEELLRVLGVAVSQQLHRTLDIGEQHGDLLALTFKGCPGGENLIGKVLGRVTLGRGKAGIARNTLQGMATLGAELGCGQNLASTVGTGSWQRCSTLFAERSLNSVLGWHFGHFIKGPGGRSETDALRG